MSDFVVENETLIKYIGKEDKIVVPNTIKQIGKNAFSHYPIVADVELSDINIIEENAFYCSSIKQILFGDNLQSIDPWAFRCNKNLISLSFPKSLSLIDHHAFYQCKSLKNISLSEGLKTIRDFAFAYCPALENLILPKSLSGIGRYAFVGCESLKYVFIPSTVYMIDENAFSCSKDTIFYCESRIKPSTWSEKIGWNKNNVHWGITKVEFEKIITPIKEENYVDALIEKINKTKFIYNFNIDGDYMLNHIDPNSVQFYMYADAGAMGEAGAIKYYCIEHNSIVLYSGNSMNYEISYSAIQKLRDDLYDMKGLFPTREWYCFELGYGNYLYMKPCYKDKFIKYYEEAEEHIYLCYDKIVKSILQEL